MLDNLQLSSVYQRCVPGLQSASLMARDRSNDATATYTAYALANAQRRPLTTEERKIAAAIVEGAEACVWVLWNDDLAGASAPDPREGDKVRDDARTGHDGNPQTWVVRAATVHLLGEAFHLTCVRA